MRRRLLSTLRPTSSALRVPSGAQRGMPSDVAAVLPILSQLSRGALRGTPGWVPTAPPGPGLVQRKRAASWLEITYPFASDPELAQFYQMSDGESLRAGMFLEELDAFSADCSMRHADGYSPQRPLTVVTAAHDGLSIFAEGHRSPLSSRHDLRLRGCVVGVGTSSMEVQTDLLRVHSGGLEEEYLGSCFTVMVARECEGFGKAAVHQLGGGDQRCDADAAPRPHCHLFTPPPSHSPPVSSPLLPSPLAIALTRSEADAAADARRAATRRALAANALALKPPSPSEVPLYTTHCSHSPLLRSTYNSLGAAAA
jgi:acyl-CoA hydrolase